MARPKKGEPGYEEANRKWRETMAARHGSASEFMAKIGQKGGQNGHTGGFAANRELAKAAGRKGGLKSKRGPALHRVKSEEAEEAKKKGWKWPFSRKRK